MKNDIKFISFGSHVFMTWNKYYLYKIKCLSQVEQTEERYIPRNMTWWNYTIQLQDQETVKNKQNKNEITDTSPWDLFKWTITKNNIYLIFTIYNSSVQTSYFTQLLYVRLDEPKDAISIMHIFIRITWRKMKW